MVGVDVSLSARRAWIEMSMFVTSPRSRLSLSARRAWIEINEKKNDPN